MRLLGLLGLADSPVDLPTKTAQKVVQWQMNLLRSWGEES